MGTKNRQNRYSDVPVLAILFLCADQTCLSPWERCRAATERVCISCKFFQICLMRTYQNQPSQSCCFAAIQLSQRESQEAGAKSQS